MIESDDPVTRHLAAGIADRWRDECILLRRYANAAHWWAEASDREHAEAGDTRPKARCRMVDAECALLAAGYVFDPPKNLQAAINKVRASAAELGRTIEEWNRKFGT